MDLKKISKILIFFGIALIVIAFVMDTSVSSGYGRVHNIGLVSQQQNLLLIGGVSFLAGIILIATNQKSGSTENESAVESAKIIIPNLSKIEKRSTVESDRFYSFLNRWLTSDRDHKT